MAQCFQDEKQFSYSDFLRDAKENERNPSKVYTDQIDRIMQFFVDCNSKGNNITDLEKPCVQITEDKKTEDFYDYFGWSTEKGFEHFDVINSFWTTFAQAARHDKDFKKTYDRMIYKKHYKSEQYEYCSFPEIYSGQEVEGTRRYTTDQAKELVKRLSAQYSNRFSLFASLTHSIANFTPCPDSKFNSAKGCLSDVKDYLPLMIDKIQKCIDENPCVEGADNPNTVCFSYSDAQPIPVTLGEVRAWHNWFLANHEKAFLQDYYFIGPNNRIVGIPLFDGQSLNNPLPREAEDLNQCLNEMLRRIYNRAYYMSCYNKDGQSIAWKPFETK